MSYVFDASALMAVITAEAGTEFVQAAARGSEMSIVNVSEVMSTVCERGGDPTKVDELIARLGLRVRGFHDWHAAEVARLRPLTKPFGLGFGDRACLAQGIASEQPVLTGDRDWLRFDAGVRVELFRHRR